MRVLLEGLNLMLFIIFAENLVLSGAYGATEMISVVNRPKVALLNGAVLTVATFISGAFYWFFGKVVFDSGIIWPVQALIFMVFLVILYLGFVVVLKRFFKRIFEKASKGLTVTLINALVFSVPFIIALEAHSLIDSLALGLGAGLSFILVAILLSAGQRALDNPDVPKAFKGLPLELIYMGILSMVFFAFAGHV